VPSTRIEKRRIY